MPYANPVRRRSCGDARRMLLLVMSVDSLIVGSFEGESGISHIVKARLPRIAAKPHTNGQTFRGKGQPSAFQGVDFVFANVYLRFEGLPNAMPGVLSANRHWNHAVLGALILGHQPLETQIDVRIKPNRPLETQIAF